MAAYNPASRAALDSAASWRCTSEATLASNTAYITARTLCSTTGLFTNQTAFVVAAPVLSFTVVKEQVTVGGVGEAVTYRIVVTNDGGATIESLLVVDTLSPVVTGVTVDQDPVFTVVGPVQVAGGTRYAWSASGLNMTPGVNYTFTVTGQVGLVCAPTTVSNRAWVRTDTLCGGTTVVTNAVAFTVAPPVLSLAVDKQQIPTAPGIGEVVRYQVVVTNVGTATVRELLVVDTVAAEVTGVTQDQPPGFTALGPLQVSSGSWYGWSGSGLSLTPEASFTFTITGRVGLVCAPTLVSNTGFALARDVCQSSAEASSGVVSFTVQPAVAAAASC